MGSRARGRAELVFENREETASSQLCRAKAEQTAAFGHTTSTFVSCFLLQVSFLNWLALILNTEIPGDKEDGTCCRGGVLRGWSSKAGLAAGLHGEPEERRAVSLGRAGKACSVPPVTRRQTFLQTLGSITHKLKKCHWDTWYTPPMEIFDT